MNKSPIVLPVPLTGLLAVTLVYCLSNIGGWTAPEVVFHLIGQQGFGESSAGAIAALEMLGLALAALGLAACADRLPVRRLAILGAALMVSMQFLSGLVEQPESLALTRFLCGVGQGVLMALANAVLACGHDPHARLAKANMLNVLFGAALLFLLGPLQGLAMQLTLFLLLGVLSLALAPSTLGMPARQAVNPLAASRRGFGLPNRSCYLMVLAIFLFGSTSGAVFTFAHLMGEQAGLVDQGIARALSLSILGALPGSLLCGLVGMRLRSFWPLTIALLVHALANLSASHATGAWSFGLGLAGNLAAAYFLLPYLQGLSTRFDPLGGCSAAIGGAFFLSMAGGAYLGGALVEASGLPSLGWAVVFSNVLTGLCILAALCGAPRRVRQPLRPLLVRPL